MTSGGLGLSAVVSVIARHDGDAAQRSGEAVENGRCLPPPQET